jgi:hypothetical protein
MNEVSQLKRLLSRIKRDDNFASRNVSEMIKLIPAIGSLVEANTLGRIRDEKLNNRLAGLEEIASKAVTKNDLEEVLNVLEQHTLVINRFLLEFEDIIFSNSSLKPSKTKIGISFVEQDYELSAKIVRQLTDNQIEVVTNNHRLSKEYDSIHNKELPPDTEALIVVYSKNYERYSSSSYNRKSLLNYAKEAKIPIVTIAFDSLDNSQLPLENSFFRVFDRKNVEGIVTTFFFEKFVEMKEVAQDFIKKYSDVGTILKLYNPNFKNVLSHEKNKIGFELYELEQLTGRSLFCIYLYENIYIKNTLEHVKNKQSNLSDYFILIQRSRTHNAQKRRDYIKTLAGSGVKVYFIDDFVWEKLTSNYFSGIISSKNTTFIPPNLMYQKERFDNFNFFDNWLYRKDSPTLIITGSGGIGKTTLAKELTNRINTTDDKTRAIYIDALKISSTILHLNHNENDIDLYSFYEASLSKGNSSSKISYDLFRINVDNGNIVLIVDGLDEIISRLGESFDVQEFFNSIQEFTKGTGNGKVILTSRNHFWNKTKTVDFSVETIEILPFSKDKAQEFFKKRYPNSSGLVNKAIKISESILGDISQNDFIPYVLECVAFIIEDSADDGEYYDPDFNSGLLKQKIKNDFILGKLCVREEQRTEQVSLDLQLKMFFEIALNSIDLNDFKNVCKRILSTEINDRQIEAFLAHPIIDSTSTEVTFRYDFFKNHIKNIYFNRILRNESTEINHYHIDILNNLISYNSSFLSDLTERIEIENDDLIFKFLELIEEIKNMDISKEAMRKSISSIFVILLKISHRTADSNIELNTELLKKLFLIKSNVLQNVFIIDLSCNENNKIVFDFSGLELREAYINSFDYFWNCKFDENTKFVDSHFYQLHIDSRLNTTANGKNFINVKGSDDTFKNVINKSRLHVQNRDKKIIMDLHQFFSTFCDNGIVVRKIYPKVNQNYQRNIVKLDLLIKILSREGIIKVYSSPRNIDTIEIIDKYKADVIRFHSNRISAGIIKVVFKKLKERLS